MTIQQQIWRSSNAALQLDQASYRQAIAEQRMPELLSIWQDTLQMIDREINLRAGQKAFLATSPDELPF